MRRKKKAKPSWALNESSLLHQNLPFPRHAIPSLCLEQVCLLKYLTCHTCVSWIQSCGIILVPVHTSWSYPRRCPVTPRTGGASLAAGTPLCHMIPETDDSDPATAASRHLCSRGRPSAGTNKSPPPEQKGGTAGRQRRLQVSFSFPPLCLGPANSQPIYAKYTRWRPSLNKKKNIHD